ncbi:MAG: hypothetical protein V7603_4361 [Micromonosporaceae bacterium]
MTAVLGLGALVRTLAVIAYWPAFWFPDSYSYLFFAQRLEPDMTRPFGYSAFLLPAVALHHVWPVVIVQHLLGLGIGVAVYAFARDRGVSRGLSAVLTAPLLLDARMVVLEQYLLAETLFTALALAGVMLLTWRKRPGALACAAGGLLLALAALTRTVGLPLLILPLLYLALRRVGWRPLATVAVAMVLPLGGYLVWFHHTQGVYGFTRFSGRFLWARTTTFVDCGKLTLTGIEAQMCPREPLGHRRAPEEYLWGRFDASRSYLGRQYDAQFSDFARKAILAQPGDYASVVTRDAWHLFSPVWTPTSAAACWGHYWEMTAPGFTGYCQARISTADPLDPNWDPHPVSNGPGARHTALVWLLSRYGRTVTVPGWLLGLVFLVAFALALRRRPSRGSASSARPTRPDGRAVLEPLLYTGLGAALIVAAVAASGVDPRYLSPAQPFALLGLLLATARFRAAGSPPAPADGGQPAGSTGIRPAGQDDRAAGAVV